MMKSIAAASLGLVKCAEYASCADVAVLLLLLLLLLCSL
jgi:hypothetical protein